jgi:hypothetical protein
MAIGRRLLTAAIVGVVAAACATAPAPADGIWSERVELTPGQRGSVDGGALAVVLLEVGDEHALVRIERAGSASEGRITTDPGGYVTVSSYTVHLLSADAGAQAVIEVRRP